MKMNLYMYIFVMAAVTYLIRVLPLTLLRREIRSPFLRSFLYYTPYVTLTAMTFPSIFSSTQNFYSAVAGVIAACAAAWFNQSLITVALAASAAVYVAELILL